MKGFKKVIEWILNILIVLTIIVMLIGIYYVVQIKLFHKSYADMFGYTFFEVATGSMADTIQVGDAVIVKLLEDKNNIQENDIIVFQEEEYFITHRITKIEEDSITTKGDANNSEDKPIQKEAIIGKVIKIIPNVSTIKKTIFSPPVLMATMLTIIIVGIAFTYKGKDQKENK